MNVKDEERRVALSVQEVGSVRRLHPDGECDHDYSGCREAQWVATLDRERGRVAALSDVVERVAEFGEPYWQDQPDVDALIGLGQLLIDELGPDARALLRDKAVSR